MAKDKFKQAILYLKLYVPNWAEKYAWKRHLDNLEILYKDSEANFKRESESYEGRG